jgi:hypothetical protein
MIQKGASTKGTDEICIGGLDGSKKICILALGDEFG